MEVLDFAGPLEVLGEARDRAGEPYFDICFAAPGKSGAVEARNRLKVEAETALEEVEGADLLVIPGGRGVEAVIQQESALEAIRSLVRGGAEVFSICTGSWILAEAGLLDGKPATSHFLAIDRLEQRYPRVEWQRGVRYRFYEGGLTSAGVSAGMDAAFALLARRFGQAYAHEQAKQMEYNLELSS